VPYLAKTKVCPDGEGANGKSAAVEGRYNIQKLHISQSKWKYEMPFGG